MMVKKLGSVGSRKTLSLANGFERRDLTEILINLSPSPPLSIDLIKDIQFIEAVYAPKAQGTTWADKKK